MMDEIQLEKYLIREALDSMQYWFVDCVVHDKEESDKWLQATGYPSTVLVLVLKGLIADWSLALESTPRQSTFRELLETRINQIAADVVARTTENRVEHVSVSEEIARRSTTTVETRVQKSIAAGETDRDALLEILRSGRKLTPQQRKLLGMKRCSRCQTIKPFSEFKESNYADGYFAWCNACDTPQQQPPTRDDRSMTGSALSNAIPSSDE